MALAFLEEYLKPNDTMGMPNDTMGMPNDTREMKTFPATTASVIATSLFPVTSVPMLGMPLKDFNTERSTDEIIGKSVQLRKRMRSCQYLQVLLTILRGWLTHLIKMIIWVVVTLDSTYDDH